MQKIPLGTTELMVSPVCLGTANFGEKLSQEQAFALLDGFVAGGGNFLDTANVYCRWVPGLGNCGEQIIGRWLKKRGAYRNVVVATKGAHYDFDNPAVSRVTPAAVAEDLADSLRTLGLAVIDLYWLHRDDETLPIEAIVDMMEGFVQQGKIRYYGASNFKQPRLARAAAYAEEKGITGFSAVSNQWSLASVNPGANPNPDPSIVMVDQPLYDWHCATGTPLLPYSSAAHGFFEKLAQAGAEARDGVLVRPLPAGALSEELAKAYLNPRNLRLYEALLAMREETGVSLQSLSLACLRAAPFPVVPVGAVSRPAQLAGLLAGGEAKASRNLLAEYGV